MGCHDVCPKGLPLLEQYAYLRRKMLTRAFDDRRSSSGLLQIDRVGT